MFIRIRYKASELNSQRFIPYEKKRPEDPDYKSVKENIDFFIEFKDETLKNELGNKIKNLIKNMDQDVQEKEFYEHYSEVEIKYKIGRVIEGARRITQRHQLQARRGKLRLPEVPVVRLPEGLRGSVLGGVRDQPVLLQSAVHGQVLHR